jgi:hypothetical protein
MPLLHKDAPIHSWFSHAAYGFYPRFDPAKHFAEPITALPIGHSGVPKSSDYGTQNYHPRGLGSTYKGSGDTGKRLLLFGLGSSFARRVSVTVCGALLPFATILRPSVIGSVTNAAIKGKKLTQDAMIHDLFSRFQFVVSAAGNGWDCYRTWEVLSAGSIPVLRTSGSNITDSLFDDLPVLFVRDYTELTRALLEQTWTDFQTKSFKFEKLTSRYWADQIRSEAQCSTL